jgi:hypothetical protein
VARFLNQFCNTVANETPIFPHAKRLPLRCIARAE